MIKDVTKVLFYRKSGRAEARGIMGQSVTHATMHPTQSPSWEELLLIEVREEESKDEGYYRLSLGF